MRDPAIGYDPAGARVKEKLIRLIEELGGAVEDGLFVTRPACAILARTEPSERRVFELMNIDTSRPDYEQLGEFNSRVTYLSFPKERGSSEQYNADMVDKHKHLSVYGPVHVTFLIAGISVETSMELVAHAEARVARLTTSKTKAMNDALYRLQGTDAERELQRRFIRDFLELRAAFEREHQPRGSEDGNELWNILNVGAKATALTYTMSLKDYHKLFIGRLTPAGNELEVREICGRMCELLHERYPLVIKAPGHYVGVDHGEKYRAP